MTEIEVETTTVQTWMTTDGRKWGSEAQARVHQDLLDEGAKKAAEWAAYQAAHIKHASFTTLSSDDRNALNGTLVHFDSVEAANKYMGNKWFTDDNDSRFPGWFFYYTEESGYCSRTQYYIIEAKPVLDRLRNAVDQLEDVIEPAE